jgi:diaminohydroxyphosphoribosylaminopyrimidine deaminase/5-amino-6-(5-phosphoribosylamino)uracil reductase
VRIETSRQPLRVVLDRRRRVRKSAKVLAPPGDVLIFAAATAKQRETSDEKLGTARIERIRTKRTHLDLDRVFARLGELEINDVLVEAGPRLAGALFAAGLVDEWLLYVAPKLLGKDAKPVMTLPRLGKLSDAPEFELRESTTIGPDLRLRLVPRAVGKLPAKKKA